MGVVHNPVSGELFSAERSRNFIEWRKDTCICLRVCANSLLVTGFAYDVASRADDNMYEFEQVMKASQGVLRLGSAALDLCNVACGRLEGFWERGINVWDIAAGALVVLEAGGRTSMYSGESLDPFAREIVATNGLIHDKLLSLLNNNLNNLQEM